MSQMNFITLNTQVMKKMLILSLISLVIFQVNSQTTRIANNNPGAVSGLNVYTGTNALQDAIDAAVSGDIIHVIPSPDDYGDGLIDDKSLTIIGIGLNPTTDLGLRSLVDEIRLDNDGASGSRISGLVVDDVFLAINNATPHTISNVLIENCEIHRVVGAGFGISTSNSLSNLIVRNCVINSQNNSGEPRGFELSSTVGVIIENNIIRGECCNSGTLQVEAGTIRNNLFYDGLASGIGFMNNDNCTIINNIFLNTNPATFGTVGSGIHYQNNISFNTTADAFPIGVNGNTGSGNMEGVNPLLTNVPLDPGGDFDWNYSYDLTPMAGSPVLSAGTDGTDIGPTGGAVPFNSEGTLMPVIQSLTLPSVISQGVDLQVNIKAKGNITND